MLGSSLLTFDLACCAQGLVFLQLAGLWGFACSLQQLLQQFGTDAALAWLVVLGLRDVTNDCLMSWLGPGLVDTG